MTLGWLTGNGYVLPDFSCLESWAPAWNAGDEHLNCAFSWFGAFFEATAPVK